MNPVCELMSWTCESNSSPRLVMLRVRWRMLPGGPGNARQHTVAQTSGENGAQLFRERNRDNRKRNSNAQGEEMLFMPISCR